MASESPLHGPEVCVAQPRLVDVQQHFAFHVALQVPPGPSLPQIDVATRIEVDSLDLDLPVTHREILFEHLHNQLLRYVDIIMLFDELLNGSCRLYWSIVGVELLASFNHNFLQVLPFVDVVVHIFDKVLVSFHVTYKIAY